MLSEEDLAKLVHAAFEDGVIGCVPWEELLPDEKKDITSAAVSVARAVRAECAEQHAVTVEQLAPLLLSDDRRTRTWAILQEWLAQEHCGDCTQQPQTCLRCVAERNIQRARWIIERLQFQQITPQPGTATTTKERPC